MAYLVQELGEMCDHRTKALKKAVDSLETIRDMLYKSKAKWNDKQRLMYAICENTLEQIEIHIEKNGGNS